MRPVMRMGVIGAVLSAVLAAALMGPAAPARGAVSDDDVTAAIDRGVKFLLSRQKPNGLFAENVDFPWSPASGVIHGGEDAWVMVGLAVAGVSIQRDEMKRGVVALMQLDLKQTYAVAARLIALSRLYRKMGREMQERVKIVLARDLKWLQTAQGAEGQWDYNSLGGKGSRHWDLSNTQIAILAFSEAAMAGIELPRETLQKAQNLYLEWECPGGGWAYGSRPLGGNRGLKEPYGSMTAAGVASLYITRDYLYRGLGCPCKGGRSRRRPLKVDAAIRRGETWLGQHFEPRTSYYALYSYERVGLAAGIKYFGTHDWYAEGAEYTLSRQNADGSWKGPGGYLLSDTVFAICFLVKGRAPILMNKLQFDGQWDNHPRDLANLVEYVGGLKEQPIQWQVINLQVPVPQWHDAPILYVSAESTIPLTDDEKAKLRRYTDTGGTILFEASCANRQVAEWWEQTAKEIWPEWELVNLDRDHPVYTADRKIARRIPNLLHMSDGLRSIVFYARADISCPWNVKAVTKRGELFDLGANLYVYATDRGPLRARLAPKVDVSAGRYADPVTAGGRRSLAVGRLKHGGDYFVGRNYKPFGLLAKHLQETAGLTLADAGEKDPADLKPEAVHVAYLTARQGLSLTGDQQKALAAYLTGGGFLLAEAALGDKRFDEAFRKLASEMGLALRPVAQDHGLISGQMGGAAGHAIKTVRFKPSLIEERLGRQVPELLTIHQGLRVVGLYSPLDCTYAQTGCNAWACRGYHEQDARAILTNIFLFISAR